MELGNASEKGAIIRDGEIDFSISCVMGSVIYVERVFGVDVTQDYEAKEVLKHYRKIEIIGK